MTWQLASFTILGLALVLGFGWYERSRPDARIVALVATLAAFAALGRIAFAALPNVKPTTDIVLISGYALGGGPGFVVGAVAGLTSNFFFGQGPWTPWQMAAWGATGAIGAGLAALTGQRIGRWPLAIVCTIVGYAFAAVQDVGDWVTYSDHSAAQLGVYVGKGTGFDLVHAGGCLVFALAFGPALTRSVQRFARRLDVTWLPARDTSAVRGTTNAARSTTLLVLAAASGAWLASQPALGGGGEARAIGSEKVGMAGISAASRPRATSASATPTTYLLAAQNHDGGFGDAPGSASDPLFSGWAALGLAAAGHNPLDVTRGGASLESYVEARAGSGQDVGSLERTILVLRAAGRPATSLIAALDRRIRRDGSVSDQVDLTAFAVLALRAPGARPSTRTTGWLRHQQNHDGGFSFATAGGGSDVDDTGAALEALPHAGATTTRAVAFIRAQQNRDGGFPSQPGGDSNAQSTAWAVQGLLAAGVNPQSVRRSGRSPLDYLRSLIGVDGHVRYARGTDQTPVWVTAQALMALERKPLPLAAVPRSTRTTTGGARTTTTTTTTGTSTAAGTARQQAAAPAAQPPPKHSTHLKTARGEAVRRLQTAPSTSDQPLLGYAAEAGLLTALVLAPVGAT